MPKRYPEEFRRKVLDPVAAGRPVAQSLPIWGPAIRRSTRGAIRSWSTPGQQPGLSRAEQTELSAANKRIRELENKVAILKRARELLREPHDPKGDTRPSPPWPQKDCPCN